jgi:PIN domain nuclease of toxin-antitoxin system
MEAVLDAWAVMALLQDEAAAPHVREVIATCDAGMSSVNLGEAYYSIVRRRGRRFAADRIEAIRQVLRVQDPDWDLTRAAADVKARGGISYPDAFCVATARRHKAPLYTGDAEIVALDGDGIDVVDLRSAR